MHQYEYLIQTNFGTNYRRSVQIRSSVCSIASSLKVYDSAEIEDDISAPQLSSSTRVPFCCEERSLSQSNDCNLAEPSFDLYTPE